MKNNISDMLDSKLLKPHENEKNLLIQHKHTTTDKKMLNIEKKISIENINFKSRIKKIENHLCLTQNIKFNYNSKKIAKTKIQSKNLFGKSPIESLKLNKNKVVKKILSPKNDVCQYHTITTKNYAQDDSNIKVDNEILYMPQYDKINFNEKKNKIKKHSIKDKAKMLSCNNIRKTIQKERIIDISDSDGDSLIINNDEENENEYNNIINTSFPKLSSNPFLTVNDKQKEFEDNNNYEKNKLYFSPNINKKKGRCIQQAQLYYNNNNNVKSPSKTKTVISINSSTTQNSNDTINNINVYNLDTSKRKKINDLNSNIYVEGEIDNEKNNNNEQIQNINDENNNYNLLFNNLLITIKNGDEEKFLEIIQNIKKLPKNLINFNIHEKENGNSILHYACQGKNINVIKLLFKFNCEPNIKNNENQTPLHLASIKGNLDICKILIENGALFNLYDSYNKTPIHYACTNNFSDLVYYFYEVFIETDTDEKICDNLTNNKEIDSLFQNYLSNHRDKKPHLSDLENINKQLQNKHYKTSNKQNNLTYQNNKETTSYKNLIATNEKNEQNKNIDNNKKTNINIGKINIKNKNESKNKKKNDSYSKLSLNNGNSGENENIIMTKMEKHKYKIKKVKNPKKNALNALIFKDKNNNIKKNPLKPLYNPFNQNDKTKENNSLSKSKENDCYYEVNKTYDDNHKKNQLQSMNNPKKKNNCLNVNQRKLSDNNITHDKSTPKINITNKNFVLPEKSKKQVEFFTEYKNNKKNQNNNTNLDVSSATEKKNLNECFGVPSPKNNLTIKNQQLNQSMNTNNNMNITSVNVLNQMSLSLNLIREEEEKISTKSFICLALLGRGSFGEVYLVQKINTKKNYAMKILRKERIMGQNLSRYALAERNVLSLSNHPFIVKLDYAFQSMTKLFLILEYCPGGDLAKHLHIEKKFEEKRARFYLCEILLALEDLHKRNIIFRDLKPDNVVLDSEGHCKLTDFGLSKEGIDNDQYTKSFCGSIAYLAPEVLKKQGHGKAVDWYLLGVLLYEMLTGVTPYYDKNKNNLFYNIEQGNLTIPNFVSDNAKSLLKGLLQKDPKKRLGGGHRDAEEIKEHKFFEDVDWDKIYEKKIKPPKALKVNNNMFLFNKPKYFADENNLEEIFGDNSLQGWTFINKDEM